MPRRDVHTALLYARRWPFLGKLAYLLLKLLGVEVPLSVQIGPGCLLVHGGFGTVIHPNTVIGSRVKIYPGVTLGRADVYRPVEQSFFEGFVVEDKVILAPGAKILCKSGVLRLAKGSMVAANAVLLESTGEWEIWAGIPAKRVASREPG